MREIVNEKIKRSVEAELKRNKAKQHPDDFPALPDLPATRYIDPAFYDAEKKHFWPKSWVIAGHTDQIPDKGSYKLWRRTGVPIVIVRGMDDKIRAFYNTCRHRGGPVVRDELGQATSLRCTYHCWNYDLEGKLKFVPDEHEFPSLNFEERALIPVRVELLGNLIFVNQDNDAPSLAESMGPLMDDIDDIHFERQKLVATYDIPVNCNWKILQDAFQEVYHVRHIHQKTIATFLNHLATDITLLPNGHSRMCVLRNGSSGRDIDHPEKIPQPEWEVARSLSRSYNFFPNMTVPASEFEQPLQIFWPTGPNTSVFEVMWLGHPADCDPESDGWKNRIAKFDEILQEDVDNLPWIQESVETPAFQSVPLGYNERRIYHHHEMVDRVIGADNLPEGSAVEPITGPFVEKF